MNLNRRNFLRLLALGVVGHELDIDRLLWVPGSKTIFIPSKAQISLFGIPYHQTDASTGQWLGFSRLEFVQKELVELIKALEKDK